VITYCVIVRNGVYDHELAEVVLVRRVIPMPGDHVKRRMILFGNKELTLQENRVL